MSFQLLRKALYNHALIVNFLSCVLVCVSMCLFACPILFWKDGMLYRIEYHRVLHSTHIQQLYNLQDSKIDNNFTFQGPCLVTYRLKNLQLGSNDYL